MTENKAPQKFQRKKFFINKRLQIRYMISLLIPMLILIAFIGLVMYYSQYRFIQATTAEMGKDLKDVILTNQLYAGGSDCERDAKTVLEIKGRIAQYAIGGKSFSGPLLKNAYKILFLGLGVVMAELAFLTIFISHKVAGPVYRFTKFAEDLNAGNFKSRIYLRKGDELASLAAEFNQAGDKLTSEFKALLSLNERLMAELSSEKKESDTFLRYTKEIEEIKSRITV